MSNIFEINNSPFPAVPSLSRREIGFKNNGFVMIDGCANRYFYRYFFMNQFRPMFKRRLIRMGASHINEVGVTFSDEMDVVCVAVKGRDINFEETASSPAGLAVIFGLGIDTDPPEASASTGS
jgi:hypothetical protein